MEERRGIEVCVSRDDAFVSVLPQPSAISRAGVYDIVAIENAKAAEVGSAGDCFSIKAAKAVQIIETMITAMRGEKASTRWKKISGRVLS